MGTIKVSTHSNRNYALQLSENGVTVCRTYKMDDILTQISDKNANLCEYMYALSQVLDSVLDLKENESMYFQPNRDDKNSKGIITRIRKDLDKY